MPVVGDAEVAAASAELTVSDLIEETRRHLSGSRRDELNRLGGILTVSATTATFEFEVGGIQPDSYISLDDEILYVWSVNEGAKTAVVQRGMLGSTAAEHIVGTLVAINPRFSRFSIKRALQQEIRSWSPPLFTVGTVEVTFGVDVRTADLTGVTSFLHLIDARLTPTSATTAQNYPRVAVDVLPKMATDDFASTYAVQLQNPIPDIQSRTVRITYAKPFSVDTFADSTEAVADMGMSASMVDIAPIGAAWRLMSMRESVRTNTRAQGESRMAGEVPPGHHASTAAGFKRLRDERIGEEAIRQRSLYPLTW